MLKFVESRRAARLNVEMSVELFDLSTNKPIEGSERFPVEVVNISKTGICFATKCPIEIKSFYKACLNFPTKESMTVIVEVIRSQEGEDGEPTYGGSFVGISEADKFKIEVFRLFEEEKRKVN